MEHEGSEAVKNNTLRLVVSLHRIFSVSLLAFSFYCVWCRNSFHFRAFSVLLKQTDVFDLEV